MRDFSKIKAWALADDLTVNVYKVTKGFPKDEVYALTSQVRRAAYSVPANIKETNPITRTVAKLTSLLAISMSAVCGLQSDNRVCGLTNGSAV